MQFSGAISGFARALAGERLGYRSFHPYAATALLTRCLDGRRTIAWETDPVPDPADDGPATFVWVAAHSTGTSVADATFRLEVDGEHALDFTTARERRERDWTVAGRDGVTLAFHAVWEDAVADLFGYMLLQVPARRLTPGRPLALRVTGEAAGRRDWYMTFQYPIRDSIALQPEAALLATPQGPRQLVHVLLDILESETTATIALPGQPLREAPLRLGFNRVALSVDPVTLPATLAVRVTRPGHADFTGEVTLRPVHRREIWVLHHSHVDVGYSDLQEDVERKQLQNIRDALELVRRTTARPWEARFRWNTEIMWAVDRFLATATVQEQEAFRQAVREGGIGLNALYTNPLTGICRPEELVRLTDAARRIGGECGVSVRDAMITDIPGSTWATATALALGGIRHYSSGPNHNPGLEGGGDRVGHFNAAWGDRPCWWQSACGGERVLLWVAGRGYSAFHGGRLDPGGPEAATKVLDYMRELAERDYPYDMVQLRYTIGGDNGPVDPRLPDFVEEWNRTYASPRFVIATAGAMFAEFERRWGHALPTVAGDISPCWEDGALSTLRELSLARRAPERLVQAEVVSCLIRGAEIPRERWDEAWRLVHLADEHTWGAHNSVSEPDSPFVAAQWRVKQGYMTEADAQSRALLASVLASVEDGEAVEVLNTASWERMDLVVLDCDTPSAEELTLVGPEGVVASQRLADGRLAFLARGVPALGAARYRLRAGRPLARGATTVDGVTVTGSTLDNGLVRVAVEHATGAIAGLTDRHGRDCVNREAGRGLNQFLRVPGTDPALAETALVTDIEVVEAGPLVGLLRVTLAAPGCRSLVQEYRVVAGLARVEIVNRLDREEIRDKESLHFAFPLAPADGAFHLDGGWGVVRPGLDQLPGACAEFLCAGRWADLSGAGHGLTWTTLDSPLVQLGALVDESPDERGRRRWREAIVPGSTLYSYAMNNHWHTNYAAAQPGSATLRYALHPHDGYSPAAAYRRGVEANQPLLLRRVDAAAPATAALLRISSPGVAATSVRRSVDGEAVMVRLFNISGEPEEFRIRWEGLRPTAVYHSTVRETRDRPAADLLRLPAWGVLTLRAELPRATA